MRTRKKAPPKRTGQPINNQAERALLGAFVIDAEQFAKFRGLLLPADFYEPKHQALMIALSACYVEGRLVFDIAVVNDYLQQMGKYHLWPNWVSETAVEVGSPLRAPEYADIVFANAYVRAKNGVADALASGRLDAPAAIAQLAALDERKEQFSAGKACAPAAGDWDAPVPLPDLLPAVAPLPPAIIPEPLRAWAQDGAERIGCPLDFIASAAIVVASALVGRRVGIHPKQWDDWLVVPNLWGMLVGRPSTRKSPGLAEAMRGLGAALSAEETRYHAAMAVWLRDYYYPWKGRSEVRQEELKEAKKKKDAAKVAALLQAEGDDGIGQPMPSMRRYKTEDATVEKLGELLADNPLGLLCHRDELAGWLRSLDKPGREGDRAFYCESWNGTGSFDTDRISRGSIHIEALCLSLVGTIQPGPLASYVYDSVAGGAGDDGMLQCFQLTVWPDPPTSFRNVDRAPDEKARHRAYEVFVRLSTLTPEQVGARVTEDAEPGDREYVLPALRFSDEAQTVFNGWYSGLMNRLRATADVVPAMEAHLAKFPSLVPSLALLFAAMGIVDGSMPPGEVGVAAVDLAIRWAEYLEMHAERLYAAVTSASLLRAGRLLVKLRQGLIADGGTVRELYRPQWTGLSGRASRLRRR